MVEIKKDKGQNKFTGGISLTKTDPEYKKKGITKGLPAQNDGTQ